MSKAKQDQKAELQNRLKKLEQELSEKKQQQEKTRATLIQRQNEFNAVDRKIRKLAGIKKTVIRFLRSTAAYILGRRNRKQLYSKAFKRKKAENDLKAYLYYLYNLGFTEKALADLKNLYVTTNNRYLKRAAAWELTLWYANQYTKEAANKALQYLPETIYKEKDIDRLLRAAIIKAECYDILGENESGKRVMQAAVKMEEDPDLYLAAANLEENVKDRLPWINRVMDAYNLQPITFATNHFSYDDLRMESETKFIKNGPKVSVILPTYNAASGIATAIESMLTQTWQNIELLVVDDCSIDNTKEIVREYMKNDSRITLLSTPVNSGPYVARNIALQAATGKYVTVNDADDWSHAEKIKTQVKHLEKNKQVIANTSEHARLTEEIKFYRRGTPGKYIFSNMSSLLFRREKVLEKVGYWDSVRFAADGEFKRRLIKVFGKDNVADLKTGPLALPRQSPGSLTGSSAFGYNGFFKGVRKEYVESFEFYYKQADTLYYPYPQAQRLFPVPEPMLPKRKPKAAGSRHIDIVIAADFRMEDDMLEQTVKEIEAHTKKGLHTGLVQLSNYDFSLPKKVNSKIRQLVDGKNVQMLVYGESITCDLLIVKDPGILQEKQQYFARVKPKAVLVVINQTESLDIRKCAHRLMDYFHKKGKWYPVDNQVRALLEQSHQKDIQTIKLSKAIWKNSNHERYKAYSAFLDNWLVEDNPFLM